MACRLSKVCNKKCDSYCALAAGDNIARFLREVDVVESKIGDIADTSSKLLVTGMQLDETGNPTHLLSDISTSVDVTQKFCSLFNKTALSLLNEYIKETDVVDGDELRDKLRKIEVNKLLILPIKPKMGCNVTIEEEEKGGKTKTQVKATNVASIRWQTNIKSHMLECLIVTDIIDGRENKRYKVNIEDYSDKLRLVDIERFINNDIDRNIVRMSRFGYVKPIAFLDEKRCGLAIDNTYMYLVDGSKATIIASWDKKDLKGGGIFNDISKTVLYNRIKKDLNYIWQHRRYIVPYGLAECNVVAV